MYKINLALPVSGYFLKLKGHPELDAEIVVRLRFLLWERIATKTHTVMYKVIRGGLFCAVVLSPSDYKFMASGKRRGNCLGW